MDNSNILGIFVTIHEQQIVHESTGSQIMTNRHQSYCVKDKMGSGYAVMARILTNLIGLRHLLHLGQFRQTLSFCFYCLLYSIYNLYFICGSLFSQFLKNTSRHQEICIESFILCTSVIS